MGGFFCTREDVGLNRAELGLVEKVFERGHAAGFSSAAKHDGGELLVDLGGGVAKIGKGPGHGVYAMTAKAMRAVKQPAFMYGIG